MPPTSVNYTSVVQQCGGKVIQTPPPPHHLAQPPAPLVTPPQMGSVQQVSMQHLSQSQPPKSSASHQITIQSTQSAPYVSSVPLQVRTSSSKYESVPSSKFKQHIMPTNLPPNPTTHASIVQVQSAAAKQSSLQQSINNQISNQIRLHQAATSQIMTGAVASPPPKQPHLNSQQPIVAGEIFSF